MLRQRCASSLRGAPVVTTPRKPHQASDCGVQAHVTDPRDGLPAAAGISGQSFSMTPPQAGYVLQAPDGLIDLAQTPESRGAADAAGAQSVARLATASVIEANALPGRPGRKRSAQNGSGVPRPLMFPLRCGVRDGQKH